MIFIQSIKIYIAPLQGPYSEALPTQAKRKRTVLGRWWNWEQASFSRCLRSIGSSFQVVGPTTEKERSSILIESYLKVSYYFAIYFSVYVMFGLF